MKMAVQLTKEQKMYIVEHLNSGESNTKIARDVRCSEGSVRYLRQKWHKTGSIDDRVRSGRPKALNKQDDKQLVNLIHKKRNETAAELKDVMERKTGKSVCERTIRNERRELDFHPVHPQKRPDLTEVHKQKRLEFAQVNQRTDWKYVVFDDESHFSTNIHGSVVWIQKGEPRPYEYISQYKYHTSVWTAISWNKKFPLCFYKRNLDSPFYISILKDCLVRRWPKRTYNRLYYLAHDNATSHMTQETSQFLADHNIPVLLDWPPNTPELNPVDKLWGSIKEYVREKRPRNQAQLENTIEEAWNAIPQSTIQNWILHNKTVCQQLIDNQGATISE